MISLPASAAAAAAAAAASSSSGDRWLSPPGGAQPQWLLRLPPDTAHVQVELKITRTVRCSER